MVGKKPQSGMIPMLVIGWQSFIKRVRGTSPDYLKVVEWFRRASEPEFNQIEAQFELGQMYYLGYGFVKRDLKKHCDGFKRQQKLDKWIRNTIQPISINMAWV